MILSRPNLKELYIEDCEVTPERPLPGCSATPQRGPLDSLELHGCRREQLSFAFFGDGRGTKAPWCVVFAGSQTETIVTDLPDGLDRWLSRIVKHSEVTGGKSIWEGFLPDFRESGGEIKGDH